MKRKFVFLIITGSVLLSGLYAIRNYNRWHYNKYEANIEHNRDVMQFFVDDSLSFVRIAFNQLESQFANPNDFHLNSYYTESRDTSIIGVSDTIHSVLFSYFLNNDAQEKLSNISVHKSNSQLDYFNIDSRESKEFLTKKASQAKQLNQTLKELKEFLDSLPPERRKRLSDTLAALSQE